MTGQAKSELVLAQERMEEHRQKLEQALAAYQEEQEHPTGPRGRARGYRPIAQAFDVDDETLRRFAKSNKTRLDRSRLDCKLWPPEEEQLVRWIEGLSVRHLAPTKAKVLDMALRIYRARFPNAEPLGSNWYDRFKARHHKRLKTAWASSFDSQRAAGLNPTAVSAYFNTVSRIYEEEDVPEWCRYGCDETGFWGNISASVRVIGCRSARAQLLQQSGDRENTTVMATICADGSSLPPFVIFKGERLQRDWGMNNPGGAR